MKKFYCDNWLAKVLLGMSSCSTITLGPFVVSRMPVHRVSQKLLNHECTHIHQWTEMTLLSGAIILTLMCLFDIPSWILFLSGATFYLWYGIEFIVRLIFCMNQHKAYKTISFEKEANENEMNSDYLERRNYFAWLKYLF